MNIADAAPPPDPTLGIVALVGLAVILIAAAIVLVVVLVRRNRRA